jgi:hypothetical protein
MQKTRLGFTILIIFLSSLIIVESANAKGPSTPVLDVKIINGYYTVPTTSTDQYNTVNSINISLTFQIDGVTSYCLLQCKDHFSSQWESLYQDGYNVTTFLPTGHKTTITIWGNNATGPFGQSPTNEISLYFGSHWGITVPLGSQLDFRVQAIAGSRLMTDPHDYNLILAIGSESDWSSIQTVTIPENNSSTPTPTVPEFSWLIILPLFLSILSIAVLIRKRKVSLIN